MEGKPGPEGQSAGAQPSEEELRARIEEQLAKVRIQDLLLDSVASIVNLTARRIAKEDERDLEQARVGIEAVRSLVGLLEEEAAGQVRTAVSELQLLYARAAKGEPLGGEPPAREAPGAPPEAGGQRSDERGAERPRREPPPKLWTPGRD